MAAFDIIIERKCPEEGMSYSMQGFIEICEWVWAFRAPMDQIINKVIFKEKLVPILEVTLIK